jgi:CheY-like chemotaxis protein
VTTEPGSVERTPCLFQPRQFPVARIQAAYSQEDGREGINVFPSRGRVLIVEDEYFVALDIEDALSSVGFTIVGIATTAEEAVKVAEAEKPDVVLMDIRLAGARDGIEAAAEIRNRLGIPSLFATAHSDAGTRARGNKAASPLGWLTKPYSGGEVALAVTEAIAKVRGNV